MNRLILIYSMAVFTATANYLNGKDAALTAYDKLEQRRIEVIKSEDDNGDNEVIRMVRVAFSALEPISQRIYSTGLDSQWVTRLESLPLTRDDQRIHSASVAREDKLFLAAAEGYLGESDGKDNLPAHLMRRSFISRVLAVHYFINTKDYATARRHIKQSTTYLNTVRTYWPKTYRPGSLEVNNEKLLSKINDTERRENTQKVTEKSNVTNSKDTINPELTRFYDQFKNTKSELIVSKDTNANKGRTGVWITLKYPRNQKEFLIYYTVPILFSGNTGGGGLTLKDESLEGQKVEVKFDSQGHPYSIKNLSNGNACDVKDWKVVGYGW